MVCGALAICIAATINVVVGFQTQGQILHASGPLPSFEVATIRPSRNQGMPVGPVPRNISHSDLPMRAFIEAAYNLPLGSHGRVLGGPGWIDTNPYVIDGKIPDALFAERQEMTPEQRRNQTCLMWQALLADRFKLKVHFETRVMPIYELVVAKGGPKLTPRNEPPPHGCPVAFYSDKHSVFRINRDAQGGSGITQFGRALAELNIEIICANSSQAKGRVERANRTLQDRLVKELRLENVCDMDTANMFLSGFVERFNERFALRAAKPENLHRPLNVKTDRLNDILCHREQRYVSDQLTMSYDRKQIILERSELSEGLGGKYVDLYEFPDGRLEVRWKGHSLPYRVFSKDQRVSHTAVVENKRLSHALTIIKAQQDLKNEPKIKTNSEKIGYKKNPRQLYGANYKAKIAAAPAVEMTA
jgi:uncharacterized protein (TIGR03435 family)